MSPVQKITAARASRLIGKQPQDRRRLKYKTYNDNLRELGLCKESLELTPNAQFA